MGYNHAYLAVISLDSALKKDENYYLQVFLEECKYIEKKVIRYINVNLRDFSSSDESDDFGFSFNEGVKTFLLCKLLPSLDYKEVLFTTLSKSYADY